MRTPLAPWDYEDTGVSNLVWFARLDKKYQVEVQRTGEYSAVLCIFDHTNNDRLLVSYDVGLAYGAQFGPDVGDVRQWQEKVINFIDTPR
ncbi:MAG: hypothetical protein Q7R79_05580 [bacterium]|nr:hypothetical protein [bacterium]